jgi:hypothetical protein
LDAHPDTPPVVVTDTVRNAIRIVALDKRARPHGIKLNQTLSDARALVPELDCHPADDEADRALLLEDRRLVRALHAACRARLGPRFRARSRPVHGYHRLRPSARR